MALFEVIVECVVEEHYIVEADTEIAARRDWADGDLIESDNVAVSDVTDAFEVDEDGDPI